jgi:hypothetical protein
MDIITITRWIAIIGVGVGLLGILARIRDIMNRPFKNDLSRTRGSPWRGMLYAFTLGMAPWEKESTRIHWIAYFRGIIFHVGIFTAFGVLLASPWLAYLPGWLIWLGVAVTGAGALLGYAGILIRAMGENERTLSLPDDYFSVFLTSTFTALAALSLLVAGVLPIFYLVTASMMVYIPFSKIRHCVYFFYSKFYFGMGFGRRGVIGASKSRYAD